MTQLSEGRVVLVTVTYGDRHEFCATAVRAAYAAGVTNAVVVLNGYRPTAQSALRTSLQGLDGIEFVVLEHNTGSAPAFAEGLKRAQMIPRATHAWLLDDDNAPESKALETLLHVLQLAEEDNRAAAAFAYRPANKYQAMLLTNSGEPSPYPHARSFLYFDLGSYIRARAARSRMRSADRGELAIPIPYGPYGGLLLPIELLKRMGLPRADFVLYEDDTEYTQRIASSADLLLVPAAQVHDLQVNWLRGEGAAETGPQRLLAGRNDAKLYYSTRNRAYLDVRRPGNRASARFACNVLVYAIYLVAAAARGGAPARRNLRIISRASLAGFRGHLGPVHEYRLS